MEIRQLKVLPLAVMLAAFLLALTWASAARADSSAIDFEPPTYQTGTIDGQDGWSSDGAAGSGCAVYDHEVAENTYDYTEFGAQSLRISNAVTSGCFGDQTFSRSLADEAGETSAEGGGMSGGDRQRRFEASWQFASTVPNAEQPGLSVVVSPDRGDGARMSWVQMKDTPTGLEVNFYDYQRDSPDDADGKFVLTNVASGLDRTAIHTVDISMGFLDGPANDVVTVTVDGTSTHTGTSWEDYFRDEEGNPTRTVDSLLYRTGGPAAPATDGEGFVIDNLNLESLPLPPVVDDDGLAAVDDCDANTPSNSTIQAAVDAASAGDTIQVCPGTYPESVDVNKSLTLEGAQAGVDARDSSRTGLPADESVVTGAGNNGETPFTVAADNVTIDGFTVEDNTNVNVFGAGVFLSPGTSGTDFSNNIVQDNIVGLFLANDSATDQTVIQQNLFQNNNQPGSASGTGIYTDQFTAGSTLTNVLIDDNMFTGNDSAGVGLSSTDATPESDIEISNNVMDGNGNGLYAFNLTSSSITQNEITDSVGSQVALLGGVSGLEISDNTITGGATNGVRIGDFLGSSPNSDIDIIENILEDNDKGINVGTDGISAPGVEAHFNRLDGNTTAGIQNDDADTTVNAENNWWGCNEGPNQTGCSAVTGAGTTDFDPWLVLTITADDTTLNVGQQTTLTADMTTNSDDEDTSSDGVIPDGEQVTFASGRGPVNPTTATITDGTATSTLTANNRGMGAARATVDNATAEVSITVGVPPTISIADTSVIEGNSGTNGAKFTVTRRGNTSGTSTVQFATSDASATNADNDYEPRSFTITFAPGQTTRELTVKVNGDTKDEPNENFKANLSAPTNATITDRKANGTIINDDD